MNSVLIRRRLLEEAGMISIVEGIPPLTLPYSKGKPLKQYQIFGNSEQNGTPQPENPVDIQSVGDLVTTGEYQGQYRITVTVSVGASVITTYIYLDEPLRKVGNSSDYIDFKHKKVVRKNKYIQLLSSQFDSLYDYSGNHGVFASGILPESVNRISGLCNRENRIGEIYSGTHYMWLGVGSRHLYWIGILDVLGLTTLQQFKTWLDSHPTYIVFPLNNPTEETISLPPILTAKGTAILSVGTETQPSKMYAEYIKGELPAEYQEVEWIAALNSVTSADNGSHIKTGYKPNINTELKFRWKFNGDNGLHFTGYGFFIYVYLYKGHIAFGGDYAWSKPYVATFGSSSYTSSSSVTFNQWNNVTLNKNGCQDIDDNGNSLFNTTFESTTFETNNRQDLVIFGHCLANRNPAAYQASNGHHYCSDFSILENGIELHHYIPCYRKADGEIGMYDVIENLFLTNSGTQPFQKGADVN